MSVLCDRGGCINFATKQFHLVVLTAFSDAKIEGFMSLAACDVHATSAAAHTLVADREMRQIVDDAFAAGRRARVDWPRSFGEFIPFADVPEQHRRVA